MKLSVCNQNKFSYSVYNSFSFSVNLAKVNVGFDKDKSNSEFLSQPKFEYKNRSEHEEPASKNTPAREADIPEFRKKASPYAAQTCPVSYSVDRTRYET